MFYAQSTSTVIFVSRCGARAAIVRIIKSLVFSYHRWIHSVQGLTDLKKITPQQLITCFFIFYFYTLRHKINNQFLDETCIQLLDPSIVITVEAYISLLILNCLEVWTHLRPFLPDNNNNTFSIALFPAERAQRACSHTCT